MVRRPGEAPRLSATLPHSSAFGGRRTIRPSNGITSIWALKPSPSSFGQAAPMRVQTPLPLRSFGPDVVGDERRALLLVLLVVFVSHLRISFLRLNYPVRDDFPRL
jgi:hypothetical protein